MFQVSVRYVSMDGRTRKCFSIPLPVKEAEKLYWYYAATGHIADMVHVKEG